MKRTRTFRAVKFVLPVLLLFLLIGVGWCSFNRHRCKKNLAHLWFAVFAYEDANQTVPPSLGSMSNILMTTFPLVCPSSGTVPGSLDNADEWADYVYVATNYGRGPALTNIPGEFPIFYERSIHNHCRSGVHVKLANGDIIWDAGAEWIQKFIRDHPEYRLPLVDR